MKAMFAHWELFWEDLKYFFRTIIKPYLYHPVWLDDNERLERYWPCSDKPQFWPYMVGLEDKEE